MTEQNLSDRKVALAGAASILGPGLSKKKPVSFVIGDTIGRAVPLALLLAACLSVDGWLQWAIAGWLVFVGLIHLGVMAARS